jgi:hypothetical protein
VTLYHSVAAARRRRFWTVHPSIADKSPNNALPNPATARVQRRETAGADNTVGKNANGASVAAPPVSTVPTTSARPETLLATRPTTTATASHAPTSVTTPGSVPPVASVRRPAAGTVTVARYAPTVGETNDSARIVVRTGTNGQKRRGSVPTPGTGV